MLGLRGNSDQELHSQSAEPISLRKSGIRRQGKGVRKMFFYARAYSLRLTT